MNQIDATSLPRKTKPITDKVRNPSAHKQRIFAELHRLGLSRIELARMEANYLPQLVHVDEYLGGALYGQYGDGHAILVATDKRVIFLDRKPIFTNFEDVDYRVVSGVSFASSGLRFSVTLHTRIKDYTIRTFNRAAAQNFVEFIEARTLEHHYYEDYQ